MYNCYITCSNLSLSTFFSLPNTHSFTTTYIWYVTPSAYFQLQKPFNYELIQLFQDIEDIHVVYTFFKPFLLNIKLLHYFSYSSSLTFHFQVFNKVIAMHLSCNNLIHIISLFCIPPLSSATHWGCFSISSKAASEPLFQAYYVIESRRSTVPISSILGNLPSPVYSVWRNIESAHG